MVKLTNEEEHWLREFAKDNELFESILTSYEINRNLSSKQCYRIRKEINKEENDGDSLLLTGSELFLLIILKPERADSFKKLSERIRSFILVPCLYPWIIFKDLSSSSTHS